MISTNCQPLETNQLSSIVKQHGVSVLSDGVFESLLVTALRSQDVIVEPVKLDDQYHEFSQLNSDLEMSDALLALIPLNDSEVTAIICDNIRSGISIEAMVSEGGRLQLSEIEDFLKSAQATIIAANRQAEERDRNSQDEAWRRMAYNISHKLGNILPFTLDAVERIAERVEDPRGDNDIGTVRGDLMRCHDLMTEFQKYATPLDRLSLQFNKLTVADFVDYVASYLNSQTQLKTSVAKEVEQLTIEVDKDLLRQDCFAQLVLNAKSHAGSDKTLVCRLDATLDAQSTARGLGQYQRRVVFTFSDNGIGVPEANKRNIFNPLFSTNAQGTGLGLSIAKRVVEGHRGMIDEVGTEGIGARFRIFLRIA